MSLYLLEQRNLIIKSTTQFDLPLEIVAKIKLAPEDAFGENGDSYRTTVKAGNKVKMKANLNEGTYEIEGKIMNKLSVDFMEGDFSFNQLGKELTIKFNTASWDELNDTLQSINNCIPAYLSLTLGLYVWIKKFTVIINKKTFNYRLEGGSSNFIASYKERNEKLIKNGISHWLEIDEAYNRLLCACLYLRQAERLLQRPSHSSSLTSEILLNLNKSIEILFTSCRDTIRKRAEKWGLDLSEVEKKIIPLSLIRNELDIAHVTTGLLNKEERDTIDNFLNVARSSVQRIVKKVLEGYINGQIVLKELKPNLKNSKKKLLIDIRSYLEDE